jgi:DNA-directed RNA polymerase specialized sigma24 family protein
MNKSWVLTQGSFDALLDWLDPEREQAGQKYEQIRTRLIKIFTCRGCCEPELLADETINRVIKRVSEIRRDFKGEQSRYFYGVANKVYLEYLRRREIVPTPLPPTDSSRVEAEFTCLEECLDRLPAESRELVLQYHQADRKAKIEQRKKLAQSLGIAPNALRIRAHRIRGSLQQCLEKCLERHF